MSTDVNSALSKVTSQKAAFLVEAWLVHQAIPDVSTLKFIAAMLELEFEIVRYWFYCRSNFDGIKRAFAESAAEGSKSGILLPSLDEYYLLDKFSEDIDWDYERPKQKLHKHQEELTSNSSTTKMTPQSLQQKDDSISISFSDSPKDLSPINSEHSSSKPGRRKLARKLSKDTLSGNSENENDSSNDSDELLLFGNRSGTSTRIARGKLKGSRPLKPPPIQEVSDVAPRKRGRPPGKSKKSKKAKDEELFSPPPYLARMIDQQQQQQQQQQQREQEQKQQEQDLSKMSSSEHLESIETSEKDISPQFLILLPSSKSQMDTVSKIENSIAPQFDPNKNASLPVAQEAVNNNINIQSLDESTSSTPTTIKASLVGDPVTGEEIRKKIIEQQSVSERERRARIRAQSKLVRGRDSTSNSLVSPQLLSKSKKTKAISSGDRDGGKDEELRNKADNTQNYLSNHNNENGDDKKTNQSNGPLGNIQSFFKEFASIKPKRREKQPIQPQPTNSPSSQDFLPYSSQTTESQQPQTPTTITMEPLSPQYPLPPNVATPTLPSQPYFGGSTQQYRRDREDYGDDSMYSSDRTHRQLSRLHGSFQSKEKLYDRAQDKSSTRSVSRGRSRQPRQLNFRPQIYCEAAQVPNILDGIINEPHGSNAHKDETSSPRLYGQRRFSFDGSRSPYSPEPFDPELLTKLAAKEESIVSLASCQSQPTQSEIHHPLPESQRLPKTENTGDYQDIKYEHQHSSAIGDSNGDQYHISSQHNSSLEPATDHYISINMTQARTRSAGYSPNSNNRPNYNSHSADASVWTRQSSLMEPDCTQVFTKALSPISPSSPYSPTQPNYQPPESSTTLSSQNQPQNLNTQHHSSHSPVSPEGLTRTASDRGSRHWRDDNTDNGDINKSKEPALVNQDSTDQYVYFLPRHLNERQGSSGERGDRKFKKHYPHQDRYSPSTHQDNRRDIGNRREQEDAPNQHDREDRGEYYRKGARDYYRQSYQRNSTRDQYHRRDYKREYEMDSFRGSRNRSRDHMRNTKRRLPSMNHSHHNRGHERTRHQPDVLREY